MQHVDKKHVANEKNICSNNASNIFAPYKFIDILVCPNDNQFPSQLQAGEPDSWVNFRIMALGSATRFLCQLATHFRDWCPESQTLRGGRKTKLDDMRH